MLPVLTGSHLRICDESTIRAGVASCAGLVSRVARRALRILRESSLFSLRPGTPVLLFCGGGNNGADGFALAGLLAPENETQIVYTGRWDGGAPDYTKMSEECAARCREYLKSGGVLLSHAPASVKDGTVVVDAMIGIGLHRAPEGSVADAIRAVGGYGVPVLALDVPTGVDADTGAVPGEAVNATLTLTVSCFKPGLLFYPGRKYAGEINPCDIGIVTDTPDALLLTDGDISMLPRRAPDGNKGTYGRVLVIGGSAGMGGAAYFAALSAYRCGAGLVEICGDEHNRTVLQILLPEAIFTPFEQADEALARADGIVIGCGLAPDDTSLALLKAALNTDKPLVVDAGGLNLLAAHPELLPLLQARVQPAVLTPHPAEAGRLLRISVAEIKHDLIASAGQLASAYPGSVCVLKDAGAVITDGRQIFLSVAGNDALATGGSGDCLAGIIGSLLTQHRASVACPPLLCAALGAFLHGKAGESAAARLGSAAVMGRDIANAVGDVL